MLAGMCLMLLNELKFTDYRGQLDEVFLVNYPVGSSNSKIKCVQQMLTIENRV